MTHYSFQGTKLEMGDAHGGVVLTQRVADSSVHQGLSFIDLTVIPPGHSIGYHRHGPDDEEVYVVVSGRGEMSVNGECFDVESGDVIVNPPGGAHGLCNSGSAPIRLVVLDVVVCR